MEPKKEEIEKFTKQYLYNWYNATSTSTSDGKDELETYENWLERQIISRMERVKALEEENKKVWKALKLEMEVNESGKKAMLDLIKRAKDNNIDL